MSKLTMLDYVAQTPSVLRGQLSGDFEAPLAEAFLTRTVVRQIRIVASGSSRNAALCVRHYLRECLGCEVLVTEPFTFCRYESQLPDDEFAFVVSQSGYSTNALAALDLIHRRGRPAIGVTGDVRSDFCAHADLLVDYGVGEETVGYVTKGVTSLCLFLCLFALRAASLPEEQREARREQLEAFVRAYETLLDGPEALLRRHYKQLSGMQTAFFVGAGPAYGVAAEASLKLAETMQIPTAAYELEEFVHGPNLQLTPNHTLFFIACGDSDRRRAAQLCAAARLVSDRVFLFTDDPQLPHADLCVQPGLDEMLSPLCFLPFFQIISYDLTEELHLWHSHPLVKDFEAAVSGKSAHYIPKEVL